MSLSIVPLDISCIDSVSQLAREIWLAHYPPIIGNAQTEYMLAQRYDRNVIREELERGDVWWDVLEEDGRVVAFASSFTIDDERAVKLDKLYVHPTRQRRGFGRLLIDHTVARAKALGYTNLVLAVNKHNANAIAAYRKHGFEVIDAVVKDIGGGFVMDDYIMARSL